MFNLKWSIALIKLISNAGWLYNLATWWTQGRCPGMLQIGQRTLAAWISRVLENYLISSFWICIVFVQYVICVFYLCLCLIESMSPRPSNHLSSALTPDTVDTILQAEKRDHQDKHHKYIRRTTNNILGNALEKHNKYIRRVWKKLLPGHLLGTPNSRGRHDDTASSTYSKKHIWSNIFEINKRMKQQS